MTFSEFKAAVIEGLGPDGQRTGPGVSGLDAFRDRSILMGMVDMQRHIEALRGRHEETYTKADLTLDGSASYGVLPAGALAKEFWRGLPGPTMFVLTHSHAGAGKGNYTWNATLNRWDHESGLFWLYGGPEFLYIWDVEQEENIYTTLADTPINILTPWLATWQEPNAPVITPIISCEKHRLDPIGWGDRYNLSCGRVAHNAYLFALHQGRFFVHPAINDETMLTVVWEGIKMAWGNDDQMGDEWDAGVAEAVAEYAKFKIVRQYDKDAVARSVRHQEEYVRLRKMVYLTKQEAKLGGFRPTT